VRSRYELIWDRKLLEILAKAANRTPFGLQATIKLLAKDVDYELPKRRSR
jgi:hypothetical protein